MSKPICIAVDGPASSGKGTVARLVAKTLGYAYIDTGAMYRSVALFADRAGIAWSDPSGLVAMIEDMDFQFQWDSSILRVRVNGEDVTDTIRLEHIGHGASNVGIHPGVRAALVDRQRALGADGGIVMDGRDIGTVVLPQAEVKIYLDASPTERAHRRHKELTEKGTTVSFDTVLSDVISRDEQDKSREQAPLIQAEDAIYLDTTGMSPENAAATIIEIAGQHV